MKQEGSKEGQVEENGKSHVEWTMQLQTYNSASKIWPFLFYCFFFPLQMPTHILPTIQVSKQGFFSFSLSLSTLNSQLSVLYICSNSKHRHTHTKTSNINGSSPSSWRVPWLPQATSSF